MSGLNVALINNRPDALSYITPISDAEVVLYDLLSDAEFDAQVVENQIEDLNDNIAELKDENEKLKAFFDAVAKAYNDKLGSNGKYEYDEQFFLDEVVNVIKNS
jgi:hypothetical protein